jgi:hypothetical protein
MIIHSRLWPLIPLHLQVSKILEDPFTSHPNTLPLQRLQYEFNSRIAFLCKEFLLPSTCNSLKISTETLKPHDQSAAKNQLADSNEPGLTANKLSAVASGGRQVSPFQPPPAELIATAVEKLRGEGHEGQTNARRVEPLKDPKEGSSNRAEVEEGNGPIRQKPFLKPVREETQESLDMRQVNHTAALDLPPLTRSSSNAAHLPPTHSRSNSAGRIRSPPKTSSHGREPRPVEPLKIMVEQKIQQARLRPAVEAGSVFSLFQNLVTTAFEPAAV